MAEATVQTLPIRSIWYSSEDPQHNTSEGYHWRMVSRPHAWRPPTDVYETDEAIIVRVEIAGVREEDFAVSLEDRFLIIRGIRADIPERRAYHQMEIPFGEFSSEIELPAPIAAEEIEAVYRDGFLRVVLPKAHPRQVKVE